VTRARVPRQLTFKTYKTNAVQGLLLDRIEVENGTEIYKDEDGEHVRTVYVETGEYRWNTNLAGSALNGAPYSRGRVCQ
jgi:hypothetical protein